MFQDLMQEVFGQTMMSQRRSSQLPVAGSPSDPQAARKYSGVACQLYPCLSDQMPLQTDPRWWLVSSQKARPLEWAAGPVAGFVAGHYQTTLHSSTHHQIGYLEVGLCWYQILFMKLVINELVRPYKKYNLRPVC